MLTVAVDTFGPALNEAGLSEALSAFTDARVAIDAEARSIRIDESNDQVAQVVLGLENAGFKVKSLLVE